MILLPFTSEPLFFHFWFQVTVQFDKVTAKPGDNITTTIKAEPNSYICMIGRDKSVSLLSKGNDITDSTVIKSMSLIIPRSSCLFLIWQIFACTYSCFFVPTQQSNSPVFNQT